MNSFNDQFALFDKIYEKINQPKIQKIIVIEEGNARCCECDIPAFLDENTDNYICPECGICIKANYERPVEYHPNMINYSKQTLNRHKYKRLQRTIAKFGITNVKVKEELKERFDLMIEFTQNFMPYNRKNIMRYAYVISKFLELMGLKSHINTQLLPKHQTLKKYDLIWKEFCEMVNYDYIPSIKVRQ